MPIVNSIMLESQDARFNETALQFIHNQDIGYYDQLDFDLQFDRAVNANNHGYYQQKGVIFFNPEINTEDESSPFHFSCYLSYRLFKSRCYELFEIDNYPHINPLVDINPSDSKDYHDKEYRLISEALCCLKRQGRISPTFQHTKLILCFNSPYLLSRGIFLIEFSQQRQDIFIPNALSQQILQQRIRNFSFTMHSMFWCTWLALLTQGIMLGTGVLDENGRFRMEPEELDFVVNVDLITEHFDVLKDFTRDSFFRICNFFC